jgi:O-succinylbenzoate synthase
MKLKNVKIFRYHLEFQPPLQMRNQTFFHRKGLLLQLQGEARVAGFGEIAPFPWVHQENLETALQQIREFKRMALSLEFPEERKALLSFFRDFFLHSSYAPSVQFGIETAFFHLCAEMQGKSMAAFLGESPSSFIRLNALLCEDQSESEIQRIQQEDYRAVKMKVDDFLSMKKFSKSSAFERDSLPRFLYVWM